MSATRFALFLVLALAGATGAFWLSMQRTLPRDTNFGPPALPGLAGELPLVDRITLSARGEPRVTLVRKASTFGVAEFGGFPADRRRVHELLTTLADLHFAGRATGPPIAAAQGVRIDLSGRLAPRSLIIGAPAGADTAVVQVLPGENSGIAGRVATIETDRRRWLASPLFDVQPDEVARLSYLVRGESLELARPAAGAPFAWTGARAGQPTPAALATSPPTQFEQLDIVGARPLGTNRRFVAEAVVETFQGLRLELAGHRDTDGTCWLSLRASAATAGGTDDAEHARRLVEKLNTIGSEYEMAIKSGRFDRLFPTLGDGR